MPQRFASNREKIESFARAAKPSVVAVGIGGAGCNIISWVKERGVSGGRLVSMNTDANHLTISKADSMILIGEKACQGVGCGGYPKLGEKAVNESMSEIQEEIDDANIIFLCAGLGGGTGTGGIMALAENLRAQFTAKKAPHLIIGVVTLPFEIETARMDIAKK
jgi:cell division protein FtsZ